MIATERLRLRQWRDDDRAPFAAMNVDARVMTYFPAPIPKADSDLFVDVQSDRIARLGWGGFAVEHENSGAFVGFVGLSEPPSWHPCGGSVEIDRRLAHEHWGRGYASEAARASLDACYPLLDRDEIVSLTASCNRPSRRVMEKLGMRRDAHGFDHPRIPAGNRLRAHVVYRLSRETWRRARANVPVQSVSSRGESSSR